MLDALGVGSPVPSSSHSHTCSYWKSSCNIADEAKEAAEIALSSPTASMHVSLSDTRLFNIADQSLKLAIPPLSRSLSIMALFTTSAAFT